MSIDSLLARAWRAFMVLPLVCLGACATHSPRLSNDFMDEQRARVHAAAAELQRPSDLQAAGFFLGFAGVGQQRVFAAEIALAAKVMAEKFYTQDRSLRLSNDQRDALQFPIASVATLRTALADISQRMNLEQDVLVLAISTHGTKNGLLRVTNP